MSVMPRAFNHGPLNADIGPGKIGLNDDSHLTLSEFGFATRATINFQAVAAGA